MRWGDLGIACGRAAGNRAQRLPDALLERRTADVEWQIEGPAPAPRRGPRPRRRVARTPDRRRPAAPSGNGPEGRGPRASGSSPNWIAQIPLSVAATRIEPSEHSPTAKRIDVPSPPARKALRRHAEEIGRSGIEAPAGIETGAVDRLGDRRALRQLVPHAPGALGVGIGFRRHAGGRLEHAVKVKAAHAGGPGKRVKARSLFRLVDQATGMRHHRRVTFGQRPLVRPAALARAEARRFPPPRSWRGRRRSRGAAGARRNSDGSTRRWSGQNSRTLHPRRGYGVGPPPISHRWWRRMARVDADAFWSPCEAIVALLALRSAEWPSADKMWGAQARKHSGPCSQIEKGPGPVIR